MIYSPDWIFELEIKDNESFLKKLAEICQPDFCHVQGAQLAYQICSHIVKPENTQDEEALKNHRIIKCFRSAYTKREQQKIRKLSRVLTPIRFWRTLSEEYQEISHLVHALIIGFKQQDDANNSDNGISNDLDNFIVVNWIKKEQEQILIKMNPKKIYKLYDLNKKDFSIVVEDALLENINKEQFLKFIKIPCNIRTILSQNGRLENFIKLLCDLVEIFIVGSNPISFISTPVGFRTTPDTQKSEFISVEMVWLETSIRADIDQIKKAIEFSGYYAPRIIFDKSEEPENSTYIKIIAIAQLIKSDKVNTEDRVHNLGNWEEDTRRTRFFETYCKSYLPNTYSQNNLITNIRKPNFYHGFQHLQQKSPNLNIDSLLVCSAFYLCYQEKYYFDISVNYKHCSSPYLLVNYEEFFQFLIEFDDDHSKRYSISKVEQSKYCVKILMQSSNLQAPPSLQSLYRKIIALSLHEITQDRHLVTKAFHQAFLSPINNLQPIKDQNNTKSIKVEIKLLYKGMSNNFQSYIVGRSTNLLGETLDPEHHNILIIEFNETDKDNPYMQISTQSEQ